MPLPTVRANQLIGKTLPIKNSIPFFRVRDINKFGDKAKIVGKLPIGYQLLVDSFLVKGPAYYDANSLQTYAKRSNDYLTFFGKDKNNYAIKVADISVGKKQLEQAGVKTVEQEAKEQEQAEKTPIDKLFEGFGKFANFAKYLVIGITAVWATGYIIKQTRK